MTNEQFERAERLRNNIKTIEYILAHIDSADSLRLYQGDQQVLEIKADTKMAALKGIMDNATERSKVEFGKLLAKLQEEFGKL